jgi:anti-anti-sigma regulatory factor
MHPAMSRRPLTWHRDDDVLILSGSIDEASRMAELVGHARDERLTLDLVGVTFINSAGAREWIRMQSAAAAIGVRIELRRVPDVIINQLNITPATRGVSVVTSFYAPYECDDCEADELFLVDVAEHGATLTRNQLPSVICRSCRRAMDPAYPPEVYLAFLTQS